MRNFYHFYVDENREIKNNFPPLAEMKFFRNSEYQLQRDMLTLAYSVFVLERLTKESSAISRVSIPISRSSYNRIKVNEVEERVEDLLSYVLLSQVKVELIAENTTYSKTKERFPPLKFDAVCLFSGGVDSYAGLLQAKNHFGSVCPLFIAHSDQTGMISIVDEIDTNYLSNANMRVHKLCAPPISRTGYSQLRGFLYLMLAALYSTLTECDNVVVSECGVTMHQPRFSPLDEVTFTTHPTVLRMTKDIISSFIGELNVITPFEILTKAEVIATSPGPEIAVTHSCISQAFRNHDGTCYGCVIRRLGFLAAGLKDTTYNYDVLSMDDSGVKSDNLVSLLNTSYDIILNYDGIPDCTRGIIDQFSKKPLFERFAMDNFAALYTYYRNARHHKSRYVRDLYSKFTSHVKTDELMNRKQELSEKRGRPDFGRVVQ